MTEKIILFIIAFVIGAGDITNPPPTTNGCQKSGCSWQCHDSDGNQTFYMGCFEAYKHLWSCTRCEYSSGGKVCTSSTFTNLKCPI